MAYSVDNITICYEAPDCLSVCPHYRRSQKVQGWYRFLVKKRLVLRFFSLSRKISRLDHEVIILATQSSSSAVTKRPHNASCLSVVSFNIPTAQFFITSYTAASDLLVHKILLNSVLLSPIVSGGVRPKTPDKQPLALGHNPLVCCHSWVGWG